MLIKYRLVFFFFFNTEISEKRVCIENTSMHFILKVTQRDPQVPFYQPTLKLFFHPALQKRHLETEILFAWQIHWIMSKNKTFLSLPGSIKIP